MHFGDGNYCNALELLAMELMYELMETKFNYQIEEETKRN